MATFSQIESGKTEARQCGRHGEYLATQILGNIWSTCQTCAIERQATQDAVAKRAQRAAEQERLAGRLNLSGLVGRFERATFETFTATTVPQRDALAACQALIEQPTGTVPGNLILIGPPGTGKTHLASAMVNRVIRVQKRWAAIHSAREIVRMLRNTWGKKDSSAWVNGGPQTESELIAHLCSIELLVIDEVGVGFGTDAEAVQLFDIIDGRYQRELPIVLCTNLPLPELRTVLDARAYDRIREGAKVVPCDWASHRGMVVGQ